MARNPRIVQAFRAMKEIGIREDKVKPVLKRLLNLYEKNWELIESENYRVLADAIFDEEESKVSEPEKYKKCDEDEDTEGGGLVHDELVRRPLKRLRRLGETSSSHRTGSPNVAGTLLKKPKVEDEPSPASLQQKSLQCNIGKRTEYLPASPGSVSPQPVSPASVSPHHGDRTALPGPVLFQSPSPAHASPHHGGMNKGKQTVEPRPLAVLGRPEPNSHSSQMHFSSKGKELMSPNVTSNGKGPQRVSLSLHIKDLAPEPCVIPKKRVVDTHALIIPKEEPFTDDMPQDEVPIAVIHPDPLSGKDLAIREFSTGKSNWQEPPESLHADEIVGGGASASMSKRHTSCELATVSNEIPSRLEIASSQLGEVKISVSYNNSALGGQKFQLPSIDELRELMEQRCLRSYKLIDPKFDIIKILNDMCECISELATNSSNQSREGDVMPALDVLKRSPGRDALDAESNRENGCMLVRLLNGSFIVQPSSNGCVDDVGGKELVVLPQHELTLNELRWLHDASDITKGEEKVEISWVNEINKDFPPPFQYISENLVFQNAHVSFNLYGIGDESCPTCFGDCLLAEQPCGCACRAGRKFAYSSAGVVEEDFLGECISMTRDPQQQFLLYCTECPLERSKKDDFPEPCKGHLKRKVIKECWSKCGCHKQCGNRVVQRGLNYKLQVFLTPDEKGWGLRTLEKLPKGAFVCEFVGEILTISELYARNREKHTCPILLDAYWGLKGGSRDEEALCLDATCYGNVARFINHRCFDANLIEIPVEVETPDLRYYHLAFFTTREVHALEELTWDYGIDFDDLDHPVKAFRCRCGSKFCRNMKRSTRSKLREMASSIISLQTSNLRSAFLGEKNGSCVSSIPITRVSLVRKAIECKESRIGKQPITVPSNVTITMEGQDIKVKGPLGEMALTYPREVKVDREESGALRIRKSVETRRANQMHGLFRTLTDNMVVGVSKGFEKRLQLIGVGYRATLEGKDLVLSLGFSHPVRMAIPDDIQVKVEENTRIVVSGYDKSDVGQFAATIRKWRPPEPYKGKGVKYADEVVRRKEGKAGKKK